MVSNKGAIMAVSYTPYREDKISFGTHDYIDSECYVCVIACTGM